MDIEPPRIIAIDPAPALKSDDWLNYHRMSKDHQVLYLQFDGARNLQIELTFSRAPGLIAVGSHAYSRYVNLTSWELVGRELSKKVCCFRHDSFRHA